jgi:hypothetical protein
MTDESQALAREWMAVTRGAEKTIALLRKMFDGDTTLSLESLVDVEALRQHIQIDGALICAEVFSESEMRAAIAFHTSPVGQAVNAKLPLVEQRMAASIQAHLAATLGLTS